MPKFTLNCFIFCELSRPSQSLRLWLRIKLEWLKWNNTKPGQNTLWKCKEEYLPAKFYISDAAFDLPSPFFSGLSFLLQKGKWGEWQMKIDALYRYRARNVRQKKDWRWKNWRRNKRAASPQVERWERWGGEGNKKKRDADKNAETTKRQRRREGWDAPGTTSPLQMLTENRQRCRRRQAEVTEEEEEAGEQRMDGFPAGGTGSDWAMEAKEKAEAKNRLIKARGRCGSRKGGVFPLVCQASFCARISNNRINLY